MNPDYIQVNINGHIVFLPFVGGETDSERRARALMAIEDAKPKPDTR